MAPKSTLLVLLIAVICLSQFYRAFNSVFALPTQFRNASLE
jgi:hypothetical protein